MLLVSTSFYLYMNVYCIYIIIYLYCNYYFVDHLPAQTKKIFFFFILKVFHWSIEVFIWFKPKHSTDTQQVNSISNNSEYFSNTLTWYNLLNYIILEHQKLQYYTFPVNSYISDRYSEFFLELYIIIPTWYETEYIVNCLRANAMRIFQTHLTYLRPNCIPYLPLLLNNTYTYF